MINKNKQNKWKSGKPNGSSKAPFFPKKDQKPAAPALTTKKAGKPAPKKYMDLLYMTPSDLTARDLSTLIGGFTDYSIELWEAMNVFEIELPNKNTVDFEPLETSNFQTPSDAAFIRNRGIHTIFSINLCEEDLPTVTPLFEQLIAQQSGFVCSDTEDFTPVYAGTTKL